MTQVIMTNVASLNSQRQLNKSQASLNQSLERLSSGLRINSAKDDAAGLAISQRMTSQISGMNVATRNANDGISLAQTAEGTLSTISDNLQRMRELSVQSANASNSSTDRTAIQQEITQLSSEIDRVAQQTDFNGTKLLDGSFSAQDFQVGANVGQTITVSSIASARTSALGQYQGFSSSTALAATATDTAAAKTISVGGNTFSYNVATDAKAISAAINSSGIAGLTATASATTVASVATTTATTTAGTASFVLNNITINVNAVVGSASANKATALAAINAQSSATGVVASDDGTGLKLTANDGRNITMSAITLGTAVATTLADFGLAGAATTGSTVNMNYKAPSGVTGSMTFTGAFAPGAQAIAATGTSIAGLDVTTVAGANKAIDSIDAALASVNSSKANLGAIQNRFTSVVANLQSSSENLSASRSRIQDADFAAETAAMSKANILQQAGTAMLAQANSAPQNVLSLLK
ncbi:MAG: flagellin [Proteobacteria bacterium]|nr:flagellin [Pseudomonadota bacterium]